MAENTFKQPVVGRRAFVGGALAAGSLAFLSGCGGSGNSGSAGGSADGGVIKYYINNPVCIDPYNLQEDQGTQVGANLFDSLTKYDFGKKEIVPAAAASWEVNADATEFTFHLVEGAKFHDGTPVTSASFKYGWERILSPDTNPESPSAIGYHLGMVQGYNEMVDGSATELTGVSCPDDNTLVVKLAFAYADFPYVASHPALAPMPECAKEDFMTFYLAPVGNGPFKMDGKWEDGQEINLVRNDDYYGTPAKVSTIHFNIQKDVETAFKEFKAGNLDVCEIPITQLKATKEELGESADGYTAIPGKQVLTGDEMSTYYLTLNNTKPPFDNKLIRQAVSVAINRNAICETLFQGARKPADNIVPPLLDGYEKGAWPYSTYDPEKAAALLDEAGYPAGADGSRGLELVLSYNMDGDHGNIMDYVMNDLKAVGITVTADTPEWAMLLNQYQSGDYQFGRLGWIADYPVLDNFLYPLFYTGNGDNRSGFSNPQVDADIMAARSTVDDEERVRLLKECNKVIGEECPIIPLFFYCHTVAASNNLSYFYLNPQKIAELDTTEVKA